MASMNISSERMAPDWLLERRLATIQDAMTGYQKKDDEKKLRNEYTAILFEIDDRERTSS